MSNVRPDTKCVIQGGKKGNLRLIRLFLGRLIAIHEHGVFHGKVGPFNFFATEQKALDKMVMHSTEGEFGLEMDTISYYEFRDLIQSPYRKPESSAVTQTLETLHKAMHAKDIGGKERLVIAQNHLVDLLNYLEKKLGYSYFPTTRKKCRSRLEAS